MRLSGDDTTWCRAFGLAAEDFAIKNGEDDQVRDTPAHISRSDLLRVISKFVARFPEDADKPLAAKTMLAISADLSGELR
jgi:hypothetical protein